MALGRITEASMTTLREHARIDRVVADYVTLKKAGIGSMKGLCPFHDEKGPSFHVTPERGTWHCFGCGEGGDVIAFLQKIENLDFIETIERLADRFSITLDREELVQRPGAPPAAPTLDRATRARLIEANKAAMEFYTAQLFTPEAVDARKFLSDRGFDRNQVAPFGVGYAPNGWEVLTNHLTGLGFTLEELTTVGLSIEGDRGHRDRFRARLMFPIRDQSGIVIGFGGRKLLSDEQDKGPKYLNTAETPLYKKSKVLFGLDMARKPIATTRRVVVVEGYTDVMACHLAGETTAVATCGTAFGEEHVRIIRRLLGDDGNGGEVIYTFDGDSAGQKAALRAFSLDSHFQTRTSVAVEPSGMDPCEVRIASGDQGILDLLDQRIPLFEFAIKTTLSQFNLDTPEGRANAVTATAPILAAIRQGEVQSQYALRVARWTGTDPDNVRASIARAGSSTPSNAQPTPHAAAQGDQNPFHGDPGNFAGPTDAEAEANGDDRVEPDRYPRPDAREFRNAANALKVMLHNRKYMQLVATELVDADFIHPTYKAVWQVLIAVAADETQEAAENTAWVSAVRAHATTLSPTVASVVSELAATPAQMRTDWNHDSAVKAALMLVMESCEHRMERIEYAIGNPDLTAEDLTRALTALDRATKRRGDAQLRLNEVDGRTI